MFLRRLGVRFTILALRAFRITITGFGRFRFALLRVVGDVPAGPLELDRRRRDEPLGLTLALLALLERGIAHLLDDLEPMPALVALVLVNRHELS